MRMRKSIIFVFAAVLFFCLGCKKDDKKVNTVRHSIAITVKGKYLKSEPYVTSEDNTWIARNMDGYQDIVPEFYAEVKDLVTGEIVENLKDIVWYVFSGGENSNAIGRFYKDLLHTSHYVPVKNSAAQTIIAFVRYYGDSKYEHAMTRFYIKQNYTDEENEKNN